MKMRRGYIFSIGFRRLLDQSVWGMKSGYGLGMGSSTENSLMIRSNKHDFPLLICQL